ncbi:hypothetical protein FGB62_13g230 [Gracilaria domingensis]|nr:hypothetical protein FGB62_13g230 [Gracilaria domingensis]
MSAQPAPTAIAAARHFLATFASALDAQRHSPSPASSPPPRRKPRRRLRPVSLTSTPPPDRTSQPNGFAAHAQHGSDDCAPINAQGARLSVPVGAFRAQDEPGESPFLRELEAKSFQTADEACSSSASVTGAEENRPDTERDGIKKGREQVQGDGALLSDGLRRQAVAHAAHICTVSNEGVLFLEALLSLHQLKGAAATNGTVQNPSDLIHHASGAERAAYCQAVLVELGHVLRTFPIPIQRALKQSHDSCFPQPGTGRWLPPHPPNVSFRLLQEELSDVKPMSNRLKTNLEMAWDALLDMLRTYCGHKREAAGSFNEEKLHTFMSSLHPCNIDIFAARFVNLLSTHTINAQQPNHIRLLDERLHALSTSSNAANQNGVTLHRVPQSVLVAFDDVPAHKFFARFMIAVDSARFNTALQPRFLGRVLKALNKVSTVASNHEFCDAVLEARLYSRFLAVVMHAMNWAHSPFAISGSSLPDESLPRQNKEPERGKITDAHKKRSGNSRKAASKKEQGSQNGHNEDEGASDVTHKRTSSTKNHLHTSQSVRSDETPGLGSHALQWRAWHLSAWWQSIFNINELIISAVSSKQTAAVVAAAAVADVFLRFAAADPVAKSSVWFQNGLSAMKKLRIVDQASELNMPLVQYLRTDLLTCDQIDVKDVDGRIDQPLDAKYVLQCDSSEWSAIGNMRLLQECCTSLARFRKNLAECSDAKLQKTASRRITPRMTSVSDSPSPLHDRSVAEKEDASRKEEEEKEHKEPGSDQNKQERFRKEFLSRLDSRLIDLMQVVMSSRPESEEDARKKYFRVAKTLYSDVPTTVRAVAAHICGHQVGLRLRSEPSRTSARPKT